MKFPFETVLSEEGENLNIYPKEGTKVIVLGYPNNISDIWPVTVIHKYGIDECKFVSNGYTKGMKGCFIKWPERKIRKKRIKHENV